MNIWNLPGCENDPCTPILKELVEYCGDLNADELRVVTAVAERMSRGRKEYGPLDLSIDIRNFKHEGAQELLDFVAYEIMQRLKENRS